MKKLFEHKWLEVREKDGYVYSHEPYCDGEKVAVLPYMYDEDGRIMFLLHAEVTPCWRTKTKNYNSITGGLEPPTTSPAATASQELWEEAGYSISPHRFVSLGHCYALKSSDTLYRLFGVDLTGVDKTGSGKGTSEMEEREYPIWQYNIDVSEDPLVYTMYHRLMKHLEETPDDSSEENSPEEPQEKFFVSLVHQRWVMKGMNPTHETKHTTMLIKASGKTSALGAALESIDGKEEYRDFYLGSHVTMSTDET